MNKINKADTNKFLKNKKNIFKRLIFSFLILIVFSFSAFSSVEDSQIILDGKNEPAKLKIGVTKVITKELPMDIDAKNKRIYAEIDVNDSDLVFVSEELAEIPSLSSTNGRRIVNNIEKYLTKEIKKDPKFEHKVVKDEKTGKNYIVIDCRTKLTGVYIYVVEKGSYKVKEVYRGVFNIPSTLEEEHSVDEDGGYGTIYFSSKHEIGLNGETTSFITYSNEIKYNGDIKDWLKLLKNGNNVGYPLGYVPSNSEEYYNSAFPRKRPRYQIGIVYNNGKEYWGDPKEFELETGKFSSDRISIEDVNGNDKGGKISIISEGEGKPLKIELYGWSYKYPEIDAQIYIYYGYDRNGSWHPLRYDTFKLKVDKKTGMSYIGSIGRVDINSDHTMNLYGEYSSENPGKITYVKGKGLTITGNKAECPSNSYKLEGEFPKKMVFGYNQNTDENKVDWYENRKVRVSIGTNSVEMPFDPGSGRFPSGNTEEDTPVINVGENKFKVYADYKDEYVQIDILKFKTFKGFNEEVKIEYIALENKNGIEVEHLVKRDVLYLKIEPKTAIEPKGTRGRILIYHPGSMNTTKLKYNKSTGEFELVSTEAGDKFNPKTQMQVSGEMPKIFKANDLTDDDSGIVDWGKNQKVKIKITNTAESKDSNIDAWMSDKYKNQKSWTFDVYDNGKYFYLKNQKGKTGVGMRLIMSDAENGYIGLEFDKDTYKWDASTPKEDLWFIHSEIEFEYIAVDESGEEKVIKTDYLTFDISPEFDPDTAKITLENPLVLMDENNEYYRRSKINKNGAQTLNEDDSNFNKNTTIHDNPWITASGNLKDYDTSLGERYIKISNGSSDVVAETQSDGSTQLMELNLDKGNTVGFFYDGGNQNWMNFGITKYNFEGTTKDISITEYNPNNDYFIDTKTKYTIVVPSFDGLPYVDKNLDINYTKPFEKSYSFDDGKNPDGLEINLGTIGLKGLDRRITYESEGDGVEIRINGDKIGSGKVILQNENYPDLKINGEIYFKNGNGAHYNIKSDDPKNEEQIKTDLWLKIPNGEYEKLAVGGKFKILKPDGSGSPVEVGVVVNGNETKYFKPITKLYLGTDEKYIKTKIEFQNEKTFIPQNSSDNKGWIKLNQNEFSDGEIQGYNNETDGMWGKIDYNGSYSVADISTDEDLIIELYDSSGRLLAKSSKGGDLKPTEIEIGNARMLFRHQKKTNYIEFGFPEGKYVAGSSGKFYTKNILVENIDGKEVEKLLFIRKFDVAFKSSGGYFAETKVVLKNPMMTTDNEVNNSNQMVFFRSSTSSSESAKIDVVGYGNHETSKDKMNWWEVSGVVSYPETLEDLYIYDKNSNKSYNFSNGKIIMEYSDGTKLKIKMEKRDGASYFLGIGYVDGPRTGESNKKEFELRWLEHNGQTGSFIIYRIDKITVEIEEFDPRYYGTIYPEGMDGSAGYGKVGEGKEYLKDENMLEDKVLIDLGTEYRNFMRYAGYVENLGNKDEFEVKPVDEFVSILPDENAKDAVKGKLRFIKNNNYFDKIKIFENKGSKEPASYDSYKIMLEIDKEDYLKLAVGKKYNICSFKNSSDHEVLQIGFTGKSSFLLKKLPMDHPLNFTILPPPFKIEADILDFGIINLRSYSNNAEKTAEVYANTQIKVTGLVNGDFELDMDGGKTTTTIHRRATEEQISENDSLNVKDLKVVEEGKSVRPDGTIKKGYVLYGTLEIPLDETTQTGKYTGNTIVTATLISE